VVEDHAVARLGLRTLIAAQSDMEVVAETKNVDETLEAIDHLQNSLDLVILPIRLQSESVGYQLCREVKTNAPGVKVLIYTSFGGQHECVLAYLSNADGFLTKADKEQRFLSGIRKTANGGSVWSFDLKTFDDTDELKAQLDDPSLTKRESEVLGLLLQRFTNSEISHELFISVATVKTHVSKIFQKLGIQSRHELFEDKREV
jgi:DNA-binding NarL/FixJ family response regulator